MFLSRWLRGIIGVQEDILDAVPTQRNRYTALGALVLTGAAMTTLSAGAALWFALPGARWTIALVAPVWALFVYSLDRTFVAAPRDRRTPARIIARLALATAIGVVIAEPLLLAVFQTSVDQQVAQNRRTAVAELEQAVRTCNRLFPPPPADGCAALRLDSLDAALATREQLARFRTEATALKAEIDRIIVRMDRLQALARAECTGDDGPGLTGSAGEGPNCRNLRAEADRYQRETDLIGKQNRLRNLNRLITANEMTFDNQSASLALRTDAATTSELNRERAEQASGGLLERLRAFDDLSAESPHLFVAGLALRLLFISLQLLPVLVRVLMGVTPYDRLVHHREKEQINRWIAANTRIADDVFGLLEAQQRRLIEEIPIHATRGGERD